MMGFCKWTGEKKETVQNSSNHIKPELRSSRQTVAIACYSYICIYVYSFL